MKLQLKFLTEGSAKYAPSGMWLGSPDSKFSFAYSDVLLLCNKACKPKTQCFKISLTVSPYIFKKSNN